MGQAPGQLRLGVLLPGMVLRTSPTNHGHQTWTSRENEPFCALHSKALPYLPLGPGCLWSWLTPVPCSPPRMDQGASPSLGEAPIQRWENQSETVSRIPHHLL